MIEIKLTREQSKQLMPLWEKASDIPMKGCIILQPQSYKNKQFVLHGDYIENEYARAIMEIFHIRLNHMEKV